MARKKKASSGRGAGPSGGAPPSVMAASSLVSAHVGAPSGVGEEPKPGGDEVGMSETTNEMATSQGDASVPSLHANVGRDESSPENAPTEDTLNQESQREPPAMRFRFDSHKKLVWGGDGSAPSGDGSDSRLKEDSDSDAREVPGTTSEAHTTELVPGTEHTPLPVTGKQSQFTPQTQPPPEVCQPTPTVAEIVELETADPDSSPGSNARRLRSYGQTVLGIGHDDCLPVPESSPDDNDDYNADDLVVVRELNERLETARGVNGESSTWASGAEETCRVWQDKAFDLETELADERSLRNQTHQSGDYSQLLSSDLNILQLADTGRMSVAQSTVLNLVTAAAENAAFALGSRSRQSAVDALTGISKLNLERAVETARALAVDETSTTWREKLAAAEAKHAQIVERLQGKLAEAGRHAELAMGSTHTTAFEAQGTIKTLRQTIDTLEDELHKANSARRDAEAICETLETKSGAYGQTVRDLENGYAKSKEEWYQQTRAVTKKLQAATDKVDELKRSLLDADAEVGILKKQVAAEKEMRNLGKESNESATRERRRHDLRVEELELAVDSHRHKAATLEVRCCDLEMVVVSQKTQIVSLSDSLKEARDETDTLRREIESTSTSMHSLKQSSAKSAQAATQSEARLVKANARVCALEKALAETTTRNESCRLFAHTTRTSTDDVRARLDDSAFAECDASSNSNLTSPSTHRAFHQSTDQKTDHLMKETTVALLRQELDALRRVAEIQEEEVCRASEQAARAAEEAARMDDGSGDGQWTDTSVSKQSHTFQNQIAAVAAAGVPRALLERWRVETFKLLLQQREGPVALAAQRREFAGIKEGLRETIAREAAIGKELKTRVVELEERLDGSRKYHSAREDAFKKNLQQRDATIIGLRKETNELTSLVKTAAHEFGATVAYFENATAAVVVSQKRRITRCENAVHAARLVVQTTTQVKFDAKRVSNESTREIEFALRARDQALEAVRDTAKHFDEEMASVKGELRVAKQELRRCESSLEESRREEKRLRREVVEVCDASEKATTKAVAGAVELVVKREFDKHESQQRRLRLAAETSGRESERLAVKVRTLTKQLVTLERERDNELGAERQIHDESLRKKDAVIRELRIARDALLAEMRVAKATAAAAHASRRVEHAARLEMLDCLPIERINHGSPERLTTRTRSARSSPFASPMKASPAVRKEKTTNLRSLLAAQAQSAIQSPRPKGMENNARLCDLSGASDDDDCAPTELPSVSLADLEKSPSWQLQRRLTSLEARAAALLLDEEDEAARR